MYNNSVAHNYAQNQAVTSWNDDPFNLKGAFAGVANMNHEKNLTDYAEKLVAHYAKFENNQFELHLDMLPEEEQNELARLYIEANGRELTECVNGNDFTIENDYTCALLAMLKNNNAETQAAFADITRKNILIYYKDSLNDVIALACDTQFQNLLNEESYCAHLDSEPGYIAGGF